MKSIRITVLGAAAAALSMPVGLSYQSEAPASSETEACQCSCEACIAKHGKKAAVQTAPAPNLPDAPVDIEAEVARILATDLEEVKYLVVPADGAGVTGAGIAEVVDVEEEAEPVQQASGERGYMGISLGADAGGGALVGSVNPGSPAEKADLRVGDLIITAEEMPLDSNEDLIAAVIDLKVGDTVSLEIERGSEELELEIVLGEREVPAQVAGVAVDLLREETTQDQAVQRLQAMGYAGDGEAGAEKEVEVTLPSGSPTLLLLSDDDANGESFTFETDVEVEGNTFVFESDEEGANGPVLRRRVMVVEKEVEEVEEASPNGRVKMRWSTDPGQLHQHHDALPDGYVEVYTRRERRPSAEDSMRSRMAELEAEIAELSKVVAELRAELNRRNPR